jgi:DNA invertase Pin-like site-specific DNA recombinase
MIKYVSYLRVSTQKQGEDGYGIEAQRAAVEKFVGTDEIVREFVEVESGTKGDRPILAEALLLCRTTGHILVVAKIDRLYRNVYFTSRLLESNVTFKCCDMPFADKMTIQLFAVLAEWEARQISERTKRAMEQVRKFGSKSGLPIGAVTAPKSLSRVGIIFRHNKARNNPLNRMAYVYAEQLRSKKMSFEAIAVKLNEAGYVTDRDKLFTGKVVKNILRIFNPKFIEKEEVANQKAKVDLANEYGADKFIAKRLSRYGELIKQQDVA